MTLLCTHLGDITFTIFVCYVTTLVYYMIILVITGITMQFL